MRTIEFRGKRIDGEGWVYGYVDATMYKDIVVIHTETGTFGVDPETVGQFTGLYDKNGKEIYEGDVIKWLEIQGTNNNSWLEPPDDRIVEMSGVVEFKDGMFSVLNEDKLLDAIVAYLTKDYQANESNMFEYVYNLDKFPNITIDDMYICEVIGNIYDNKEQTQNIKQ